MKTSDRGNPHRWGPSVPATEHTVRPGQNRSCSFTWAAKQENSSRGGIFSLDFPFYRTFLGHFLTAAKEFKFSAGSPLYITCCLALLVPLPFPWKNPPKLARYELDQYHQRTSVMLFVYY